MYSNQYADQNGTFVTFVFDVLYVVFFYKIKTMWGWFCPSYKKKKQRYEIVFEKEKNVLLFSV